jgi:hypothetical protein
MDPLRTHSDPARVSRWSPGGYLVNDLDDAEPCAPLHRHRDIAEAGCLVRWGTPGPGPPTAGGPSRRPDASSDAVTCDLGEPLEHPNQLTYGPGHPR